LFLYRYDAKADLWSAGAVLFEMITGYPPFTGENHLDLLHNIQHKPVRLPRDVRVSKECVTLLRLLLNRNPLHRAGFHEFFEATEAFVSLGCSGSSANATFSEVTNGLDSMQPIPFTSRGSLTSRSSSLGPISEVEENHTSSCESAVLEESQTQMASADTCMNEPLAIKKTSSSRHYASNLDTSIATVKRISTSTFTPDNNAPSQALRHPTSVYRTAISHSSFAPLEPSPPSILSINITDKMAHPLSPLSLDNSALMERKISEFEALPHLTNTCTIAVINHSMPLTQQPKVYVNHTPEENEFVIVEFASSQDSDSPSLKSDDGCGKISPSLHQGNANRAMQKMISSPPFPSSQTLSIPVPRDVVPTRNTCQTATNPTKSPSLASKMFKGLLSTSPGTGVALMGWMSSSPSLPNSRRNSATYVSTVNQLSTLETDMEARTHRLSLTPTGSNISRNTSSVGMLIKTLATAEDIGRRAIQVALLGDNRAWIGMKSILLLPSQQDSIEKPSPYAPFFMIQQETNNSTEDLSRFQRKMFDMSTAIQTTESRTSDDENDHDMPFAMGDTSPNQIFSLPTIPIRNDPVVHSWSSKKKIPNPTATESSDVCFEEALACYVKSMSMLKSSIHAVQRLLSEWASLEVANITVPRTFLSYSSTALRTSSGMGDFESSEHFRKRCEGSCHWLSSQFKCILDRADAANQQLSKVLSSVTKSQRVRKVEEVIYNHALDYGRDGAVKQLLGHFDAARSCYRSAGLLIETLLMEPTLIEEDKKVLEEYVIGFCDRILEVDALSRN